MTFVEVLKYIMNILLSWPVILGIVGLSAIITLALGFIQFRYFLTAWQRMFKSNTSDVAAANADMTPFQAFINMLSSNLGNGTIAGMATALYAGGPGAAFWVVAVGFLVMILRFSEVFLSTYYGARATKDHTIGGPMLYLQEVFGGKFLAVIYAACGLFFGFIAENALQANSISSSLEKTWNIPPIVCAGILFAFMLYVVFGGAQRIVVISEMLVPIKVIVFLLSTITILCFHWQNIIPALQLIMASAFTSHAVIGGVVGYSVKEAMRLGMTRIIMASESGLGTAALFFGKTGSVQPVEDGLMSMLGTFITSFFCFILCVAIIASGVWNCGETGTPLTICAFNTVFGNFGGWIVSFLSISFGLGVSVAAAYFTQAFWNYFSGGRFAFAFALLYSLCFALGAIVSIESVWLMTELFLVGMLGINLYAIASLLPVIRASVSAYIAKKNQ